jgi:hypothetical protein
VSRSTSSYPALSVDATGTGLVSHARTVLLLQTAEKAGLPSTLAEALSPITSHWRSSAQDHPLRICRSGGRPDRST